ncbi:MAG: hypothetical protein JSU68_05270 [Phycisphaerales bacterium]|nr:MAG: hypothetical protein JSU68_05270 [Phycisphaerales bacterium]
MRSFVLSVVCMGVVIWVARTEQWEYSQFPILACGVATALMERRAGRAESRRTRRWHNLGISLLGIVAAEAGYAAYWYLTEGSTFPPYVAGVARVFLIEIGIAAAVLALGYGVTVLIARLMGRRGGRRVRRAS